MDIRELNDINNISNDIINHIIKNIIRESMKDVKEEKSNDIKKVDILENLENALETGDIILFRGTGIISRILEYFGKSRYSHVGMIIKNPKFLNESLEDGIYILESSYNDKPDSEDHQLKIGVQIHKLEDVLQEFSKNSVYIRKVNCERNDKFYKNLINIHKEIHNKPYDFNIFDWLCAKYNLEREIMSNSLYKQTKSFWCSALVSYIFYELGLIKEDINWSLIAPREFSSDEGKYITFLCDVGKEILYY